MSCIALLSNERAILCMQAYICVCVHAHPRVSVNVNLPQGACGGQRSTSNVHQLL